MNTTPVDLSGSNLALDLLCGADAIAEFLFGDRRQRRKVYYLAETTRFPVFRLGTRLCARRSVLLKWIAWQEEHAEPSQLVTLLTGASARLRPRAATLPPTAGCDWCFDVPGAKSTP